MISASKTTFNHYNLKILRLKVTKKSYEFAQEVLWISTLILVTVMKFSFNTNSQAYEWHLENEFKNW